MLGIIRNSEARVFNRALIQGSLISFVVFIIFAKTGEAFFMMSCMSVLNLSRFLAGLFFW